MVNHNFASLPWFLMPETPSAGEILQSRWKSKRRRPLSLRPSCCREGLGTSKSHWSGPSAGSPAESRGPRRCPCPARTSAAQSPAHKWLARTAGAAPPAPPAGAHYHENFDRILDLLILNFPGWPLIRGQTMPASALSMFHRPDNPHTNTPGPGLLWPLPPLPARPARPCSRLPALPWPCVPRPGPRELPSGSRAPCGSGQPGRWLRPRWRGCPRQLSPPASLAPQTGPSWKHSAD